MEKLISFCISEYIWILIGIFYFGCAYFLIKLEYNRGRIMLLPKPKLNSLIWFYAHGVVHIVTPVKDYTNGNLYWKSDDTIYEEGDCIIFTIPFKIKYNMFKASQMTALTKSEKEDAKVTFSGKPLI
jgi:hypothetical protein